MAIYTLRSGGTAHPEESLLQLLADLVLEGGVKDLSSTDNHFKVTQNTTPNMSVNINQGRAIIRHGLTAYPVRSDATENRMIGNNTSGNTRIDAVVLYIDLGASPNSQSSNVAKISVVQGTPSSSPVPPSDSAIQTAIGGSNPFLRLAHVTVANNASSIVNANIEDRRTKVKTIHNLNPTTTTYSSSITIDVGRNNDHSITLTGNMTISGFVNFTVDVPFVVRLIQDGTGGRTVTWPSNIDWFGGVPTLTTTANRKDAFLFIPRSNGRFEGYVVGQNANIS